MCSTSSSNFKIMAASNPGPPLESSSSQNMVIIQTMSTNSGNDLVSEIEQMQISKSLAKCVTDAHNCTWRYTSQKISEMLSRPQDIPTIVLYQDIGHQQHWREAAIRLAGVVIQIIEFAKLVPGFKKLSQDDQDLLLKQSAFEIVVLRVTRVFDPDTDSVMYGETLLPVEAFLTDDPTEIKLVTSIFDFARSVAKLKLNDTQLALFSAYVLLSPDRPGLTKTEDVGKLNTDILKSLRIELRKTHTNPFTGVGDMHVVDDLLALVPQLREVSLLHLQALQNLRRAAPILYQEFPAVHKDYFVVKD